MKVWTTPAHVAIHDQGQLDIIERSTGDALVMQCTAKRAKDLLSGSVADCITSLLRAAVRHGLIVHGMHKPAKLALAYPVTEHSKVQS